MSKTGKISKAKDQIEGILLGQTTWLLPLDCHRREHSFKGQVPASHRLLYRQKETSQGAFILALLKRYRNPQIPQKYDLRVQDNEV